MHIPSKFVFSDIRYLFLRLDRFPNTYTLSKCTAERFLSRQSYAQLASISIVRPSIVGASVCFPFPAWYHGHAGTSIYGISV